MCGESCNSQSTFQGNLGNIEQPPAQLVLRGAKVAVVAVMKDLEGRGGGDWRECAAKRGTGGRTCGGLWDGVGVVGRRVALVIVC